MTCSVSVAFSVEQLDIILYRFFRVVHVFTLHSLHIFGNINVQHKLSIYIA